jgi:uncharacterized protein (TIGR02246 family)
MRCIIGIAALGLAGIAVALGQAPVAADGEKAIRAVVESYTGALNKGDVDALLAHIAADADFIDECGKQFKGKATLADLFKQSLANLKGKTFKTTIDGLRFLSPTVVIVDGTSNISGPDGTSSGKFTAVWSKTGDTWLLSSVHDLPDTTTAPDAVTTSLKELEWLVGDWATEDAKLLEKVSARWTLNKSFLQVEYTVKGNENEDLTVIQYFGWDPIDNVIRSWFFDSKGGYGAGDWERKGNAWVAEWSGVLADGRIGSSVGSFKFIDDKTFIFTSVDREVDGLPVADIETKFIRKATGK